MITTDSTIDITLNLNQCIGGSGATSGSEKVVDIPHCYKDKRFDATVDKKTRYHTNLCL